jgi:hypothetical protein
LIKTHLSIRRDKEGLFREKEGEGGEGEEERREKEENENEEKDEFLNEISP